MDGFRKVAMDIVVVGWGLPRRMLARLPRLSLKGTYDRSSEGVSKLCQGLFLVHNVLPSLFWIQSRTYVSGQDIVYKKQALAQFRHSL